MVRLAIWKTPVASVPVTEVGPDVPSSGVLRATATPPAARRATTRASAMTALRSTAHSPPAAEADEEKQPGERRQGRSQQVGALRDARAGGPRRIGLGRAVEPLAAGRVAPRRVAAVVLAAGEESGVLHEGPGSEGRSAFGAAGRVHGEFVGALAAGVGVVLPAVALALVVPPVVEAVVGD